MNKEKALKNQGLEFREDIKEGRGEHSRSMAIGVQNNSLDGGIKQ